MAQTSQTYELIRNDNNTYTVRGAGGGGGGDITVDEDLNGTSTNPVENKAIVEGLNEKEHKIVNGSFSNGVAVTDTDTIDAIENKYTMRTGAGIIYCTAKTASIAKYTGFSSTTKMIIDVTFTKANDEWTPAITTYTVLDTTPATASAVGGIKLGSDTEQTVAAETVSTTAGRTYAVQLNSTDQAVVNVPWVAGMDIYTRAQAINSNGGSYTDSGSISSLELANAIIDRKPIELTMYIRSTDSSTVTLIFYCVDGTVNRAQYETIYNDGLSLYYIPMRFTLSGSSVSWIFSDLAEIELTSSADAGKPMVVGSVDNQIVVGSGVTATGVSYLSSAPASANTDGDLKFVVLSSEPATYYNGYYYIILGS